MPTREKASQRLLEQVIHWLLQRMMPCKKEHGQVAPIRFSTSKKGKERTVFVAENQDHEESGEYDESSTNNEELIDTNAEIRVYSSINSKRNERRPIVGKMDDNYADGEEESSDNKEEEGSQEL